MVLRKNGGSGSLGVFLLPGFPFYIKDILYFHSSLVNNLSGEVLEIFHLLFVDYTLIFYGAESDQLLDLGCVLLCFKTISGLKVNLSKSKLVPVEEVRALEETGDILWW